jgi:hypothetical protein
VCSLTLKNNLLAIEKNELKAFKTLVNLGSEFYIQAKVYVETQHSKLKINLTHLSMRQA